MKVRIKENSWIARLAAVKMRSAKLAIVFGHTIHLHNTTKQEFLHDSHWVCHELKHVEQYQQHGVAGFVWKYFIDWLKNGYYKNKFEVEARASERDQQLIDKVWFD